MAQSDQRRAPSPGDLSHSEHEEAERRTALPADVVHQAIRNEGENELERPSSALAWSGLAAGLSMGFSLVSEGLLRAHLPQTDWRPLVEKLGYSVGFLIVILGRQQLFTENTLTVIIPLLHRRNAATLGHVLRLWTVVLAANLLGVLLFAWIVARTGVYEPSVRQAFTEIGQEAMVGDFWTLALRGVFAGWLIALMVWLLPSAESARVIVIVIVTYTVALGGYTHIVAGAVDAFYLAVTGAVAWGACLAYLAPTLLGNIVGGVSLVAALNHAQVVSGKDAGPQAGKEAGKKENA